MKKLILTLFWSIILTTAFAQQNNIVTGLGFNCKSMVANGNIIYVSSIDNNTIYKINVGQSSPVKEEWITGLNNPGAMAIKDNFLYLVEYGASGKILKVNMTESNPTKIDVLSSISYPSSLEFKGNELYYSEYYSGKIVKIDVTQSTSVKTDVLSGLSYPVALEFKNDILYISQNGSGNRIVKTDISQPTPTLTTVITDPSNTFWDIEIVGNHMYLVSSSAYGTKKIDLANLSAAPEIVTPLHSSAIAIIPIGTYFVYLGNLFQDTSLSILSNSLINTITFPNPSSDKIKIRSSKNIDKIVIYNELGQIVGKFNSKQIDISQYANGVYTVKIYFDNYMTTTKTIIKL